MNPRGIIDANFLTLVQALQGDSLRNVQQALYDWLGNMREGRRTTPEQLDHLLELGPDKALAAVIQKIGGGLNAENLPPKVTQTLRKALAFIAGRYAHRRGQAVSQEIGRLRRLKTDYRAEGLVQALLK